MARVNNRQAEDEIRARRPFDNNQSTMGGGRTFRGWGRLPQNLRVPYPAEIDYWVYSYGTPIAWAMGDHAHMPNFVMPDRPASADHQKIAARGLGVGLSRVGGA